MEIVVFEHRFAPAAEDQKGPDFGYRARLGIDEENVVDPVVVGAEGIGNIDLFAAIHGHSDLVCIAAAVHVRHLDAVGGGDHRRHGLRQAGGAFRAVDAGPRDLRQRVKRQVDEGLQEGIVAELDEHVVAQVHVNGQRGVQPGYLCCRAVVGIQHGHLVGAGGQVRIGALAGVRAAVDGEQVGSHTTFRQHLQVALGLVEAVRWVDDE